jgi:glycopeptide antibiotics resistance protein
MTQLWRVFGDLVPIVAGFGAPVGSATAFLSWVVQGGGRSRRTLLQAGLDGLLVVWGLVVVALTLIPTEVPSVPGQGLQVQLIPFTDIASQFGTPIGWEALVAQTGGNLLLFAAGGLLVSARRGWTWLAMAWRSAVLGLLVEAAQLLVAGRVASVDDVILTVVGALVGHGIVAAIRSRVQAAPVAAPGSSS